MLNHWQELSITVDTGFVTIVLCAMNWRKLRVMFRALRTLSWLNNAWRFTPIEKTPAELRFRRGMRSMVNTTNKAAKRLREHLIDKCFEAGVGFRVFVNSGESGKATFGIKLDRERPQDQIIESNGVKLFLDPASAARISDYQLDYRDEPDGGFLLRTMEEVKGG